MIINCPKCQYPITGVTNPRRTSPNKLYSGGIYCNSCRSNLFIEMEDELVMRVIAWEIDLPVSSKLDEEPREDFKEAITYRSVKFGGKSQIALSSGDE